MKPGLITLVDLPDLAASGGGSQTTAPRPANGCSHPRTQT